MKVLFEKSFIVQKASGGETGKIKVQIYEDFYKNLRDIDLNEYSTGKVKVLSIVGDLRTVGGGQIHEGMRQYFGDSNESLNKLLDIWERWHLNDMNAGTRAQREVLKDIAVGTPYKTRCDLLREAGLLEDNGYRYGSDWLHENLPENIQEELEDLPEIITV